MLEPVRLYLVRHGETELNKENRFRGLAEAPLNDQGKLEAAGAGRLLSKRAEITRIYSSPLIRAAETATAIAINTGARMETDDAFADIDYGEWQGLTVEEADEKSPGLMEAWKRHPDKFSFPRGDSIGSAAERLGPAYSRVVEAEHGGAVVVVSHLAILKLSFCVLLGLDLGYFWKVGLDNGATSIFSWTRESGYVLERWNEPPF